MNDNQEDRYIAQIRALKAEVAYEQERNEKLMIKCHGMGTAYAHASQGIKELQAERDRLAAQVAAVKALHNPNAWNGADCLGCRTGYPCETIRALDAEPADTPKIDAIYRTVDEHLCVDEEPADTTCKCGHLGNEHTFRGCGHLSCGCERPADNSSKPPESLNTAADSQDNLNTPADNATNRPESGTTDAEVQEELVGEAYEQVGWWKLITGVHDHDHIEYRHQRYHKNCEPVYRKATQ